MSELTTAPELDLTDGAMLAGRDEGASGTRKALLAPLAGYFRTKMFGVLTGQAGKVPTVNAGEDGFEWGDGGGGGDASFPPFPGNAGRFLRVNNTADAVQWADLPAGADGAATAGATVSSVAPITVDAEEADPLVFDAVDHDTGGYFNPTEPTRLTAFYAGWYAVQAYVDVVTKNDKLFVLSLFRNGADVIGAVYDPGTGQDIRANAVALVFLEAGDYVEASVYTEDDGLVVLPRLTLATFGDNLPLLTGNEDKFLRVKGDASGVEWVEPGEIEGVPEAPQDGGTYARKDAAWVIPPATLTVAVTDPNGEALTMVNGAVFYRVPSTLNGFKLVAVAAALSAQSSSGVVGVQVRNVTAAANILSTVLTIDANETDSSTAATPAVIDPAANGVATANLLRIDITAAGTAAKGLIVELQFQKEG